MKRHALSHFDQLPDSAHVRIDTVASLFACSHSTIWRSVRAGRLPRPVRHLGRTTAWNVGQLREVLRAKPAESPTTGHALQELRAKRAALEAQMGEGFDAELSRELDACVALEDQAQEGQ